MNVNLCEHISYTQSLNEPTSSTDKPVGAACNCSDACLGNSHCQHDGQGGFVCLCLVCQYYDVSYGQCVDSKYSLLANTVSFQRNRNDNARDSHYVLDSTMIMPGIAIMFWTAQ
ncbi:hypothetical protein BsWGS_10556 [Bradybaena similaris]